MWWKIMIKIDFHRSHPYFQSNKYLACCKYFVNNNTSLVYSMAYITLFLVKECEMHFSIIIFRLTIYYVILVGYTFTFSEEFKEGKPNICFTLFIWDVTLQALFPFDTHQFQISKLQFNLIEKGNGSHRKMNY